jgi:hypothetical protein
MPQYERNDSMLNLKRSLLVIAINMAGQGKRYWTESNSHVFLHYTLCLCIILEVTPWHRILSEQWRVKECFVMEPHASLLCLQEHYNKGLSDKFCVTDISFEFLEMYSYT